MSWKRSVVNGFVGLAGRMAAYPSDPTSTPSSILVLRNNDLGDLLVVTPLFEALRSVFPRAHIAAGVGRWSLALLENNPHLDAAYEVNAPWHNKFVPRQNLWSLARYLLAHRELRSLRAARFDLGIDVLGSPWGALLLMRCGVPRRIGMRGYAGGEPGAQQHVQFDPEEHVGRSALRFAELLGATSLPACRPQVFLTTAEASAAESIWASHPAAGRSKPRLLLAPGVGLPEKGWDSGRWLELVQVLAKTKKWNVILAGGNQDRETCAGLAAAAPSMANLAGQLSLRQTLALTASCDQVACHSSMMWHAAAAWKKPSVVMLGKCFPSAAAHQRQWGYPESTVLGRGHGRAEIATVAEVLQALQVGQGRSVTVESIQVVAA